MKTVIPLLRSILIPLLFLTGVFPRIVEGGERWSDGPDAGLVLGQVDFTSNVEGMGEPDQLSGPWGVAIDPVSGKVFVAETGQNRVLRYPSYDSLTDGASAEAVLGQADFGTGSPGLSATRMDFPMGVACDHEGRLWVSDTGNARVLRFDDAANLDSGAAANGVLGQADFVTNTQVTSAAGMRVPRGLHVDGDGNLFVADVLSCRVTMYAGAATLSDGADASIVFGQTDATSFGTGLARNRMSSPNDVVVDGEGRLYVTDRANHRILRFDNAAIVSTGALASSVIGQTNFVSNASGASQTALNSPSALDLDPDGHLWVLDMSNSRILRFENPSPLSGTAAASGVVGQEDFDSISSAVTRDKVVGVEGIGIDSSGRLYVSNFKGNRVLVFVKDRHFPDLSIGEKLNSQRGNNVFNLSGSGQKKPVRTDGKEVKFLIKVGNDGNVVDDYGVSGQRSGGKFTHKYFSLT